jgi:hypothetical protein
VTDKVIMTDFVQFVSRRGWLPLMKKVQEVQEVKEQLLQPGDACMATRRKTRWRYRRANFIEKGDEAVQGGE